MRPHTVSLGELLADHDSAPSPGQVLAQLVNGEPYDDRVGFAYAYALEALIETCGAWCPVPHDWPKAVFAQLWGERAGRAPGVGGAPVPPPRSTTS